MSLFSENGFNEGKWAGQLAQLLRKRSIIEGLSPKGRVWRATWKQWIQFEEKGLSGPVFWQGKPGIISHDDYLFVGCYIERGLPPDPKTPALYIITSEWHWHGFIKCLIDNALRSELTALMGNLPPRRSCVLIKSVQSTRLLDYCSEQTLIEASSLIETIPDNIWIDCVLGVYYRKSECLALQAKLVPELSTPIIRAYEIASLIKAAL